MAVEPIVVVGASLGGLHAARGLRSAGYDDPIVLLGDEPDAPYDRPPLSKQFLTGDWDDQKVALHKATDDELGLDVRLGVRAASLDVASRTLTTDEGPITYRGLVLACGASPIRIPGTEGVRGVHVLRTLADARGLRAALDTGPERVVVIGAGFIGAEVAATCRQRGIEVTLVDLAEAPMIRGLGVRMGLLAAEIHREHGVDVRLGVGVDRIEGDPVSRVVLTDGTELETDTVLVGVGVRPNTAWLEGSGLELDDGIVCDATCLAAPGVTAAGDVARWYSNRYARHVRIEHWENAIAQGEAAARRLLVDDDGEAAVYDPTPWFWSDQYDRKIQLAGTTVDHDAVEIVVGSEDERRFVAVYGAGGRTLGVLGMNRPRHVMLLRSHATDRTPLEEVREAAAAL